MPEQNKYPAQLKYDAKAFAKAGEALVDWRSKNGTHWSWEPMQIFAHVYEENRANSLLAKQEADAGLISELLEIAITHKDWINKQKHMAMLVDKESEAVEAYNDAWTKTDATISKAQVRLREDM